MTLMERVIMEQKTVSLVGSHVKQVWHSFDFQKWSEGIAGSSAGLVRLSICLGLGLITGFLCRRYFKYAVLGIVTALLFIKLLEYNRLLLINWTGMKNLVGIRSGADLNQSINGIFLWAKAHIVLVATTIGGFFLGTRVG